MKYLVLIFVSKIFVIILMAFLGNNQMVGLLLNVRAR